jgi:hypothetical protein
MKLVLLAGASVLGLLGLSQIVFADRWTRWYNQPRGHRWWGFMPVPGPKRDTILFGLLEIAGSAMVIAVAFSRF